MVEARKRLRGVLAGVEDDNVLFDIDGEAETALVPFEWIASGKLMLTYALIAESLRAAKAAEAVDERTKSLGEANGEDPMTEKNGAAR